MPTKRKTKKKRAPKRAAKKKGGGRSRSAPPKKARTPSARGISDPRLPPVGGTLVKVYKDDTINVVRNETDFTWEGKSFPSLTAVARAVVGRPISGFVFFGLARNDGKPVTPKAEAAAAPPKAKRARKAPRVEVVSETLGEETTESLVPPENVSQDEGTPPPEDVDQSDPPTV